MQQMEGEAAQEMYIIKSETVKIVKSIKKNPVVIATLEKQSFFGEVALFLETPHSFTAVAESDVELAVINKETFTQQLHQLPPWFQTMIKSMADRLHHASELLGKHLPDTSPKVVTKKGPSKPASDRENNPG